MLLDDLRVCIGATDSQPRCALFAKGSRPFLELHHRAFTEHHKPIVPTMAVFDFHVAQQLFSQIMLQSPTMKSNREIVRSKKTTTTASSFQLMRHDDHRCNFPQMGVTPETAERLVNTIMQMSSKFFENWEVNEHMMPIWILRHNSQTRTFDVGFRPDCDLSVSEEEFKQGFQNDAHRETWVLSEASLLEFCSPAFVKQLPKKPITGDLPVARQIEAKHKTPKVAKHTTPKVASRHRLPRAIAQATTSKPKPETIADASSAESILVYWNCRWEEGDIISRDGDKVEVKYRDGTVHWHDMTAINFKLCTKPATLSKPISWDCTACHTVNSADKPPSPKTCCTNCKLEFKLIGVLQGCKRVRSHKHAAPSKASSRPRYMEGPQLNVHVQLHNDAHDNMHGTAHDNLHGTAHDDVHGTAHDDTHGHGTAHDDIHGTADDDDVHDDVHGTADDGKVHNDMHKDGHGNGHGNGQGDGHGNGHLTATGIRASNAASDGAHGVDQHSVWTQDALQVSQEESLTDNHDHVADESDVDVIDAEDDDNHVSDMDMFEAED